MRKHGRTPGSRIVTVASMPGGVRCATYSRSATATSAGSWFATSRNESFACAWLGMMVLPPGPVCPPHIPLTSAVGRAQIRSSVLNPAFARRGTAVAGLVKPRLLIERQPGEHLPLGS